MSQLNSRPSWCGTYFLKPNRSQFFHLFGHLNTDPWNSPKSNNIIMVAYGQLPPAEVLGMRLCPLYYSQLQNSPPVPAFGWVATSLTNSGRRKSSCWPSLKFTFLPPPCATTSKQGLRSQLWLLVPWYHVRIVGRFWWLYLQHSCNI